MILARIVEEKRHRLTNLKRERSQPDLMREAMAARTRVSLAETLAQPGLSIIGEIKKASPSKGLIRASFDPVRIALQYAGHVDAISVLTEESFFLGSTSYLARSAHHLPTVPFLCKDFIIDEYQIYMAKAAGASSFLLIVSLLEEPVLKSFIQLGEMLGMDALVECHDQAECARAQKAGARIIGVNNRDLQSFEVDLGVTERLARHVDAARILVSESGIEGPEDTAYLARVGVDAILVGESFMRADEISQHAKMLREGYHHGEDQNMRRAHP